MDLIPPEQLEDFFEALMSSKIKVSAFHIEGQALGFVQAMLWIYAQYVAKQRQANEPVPPLYFFNGGFPGLLGNAMSIVIYSIFLKIIIPI